MQRIPLHMAARLEDVRRVWYSKANCFAMAKVLVGARTQPLDVVAEYFGEGVAFYFAGLECYARW